MLVPYYPDESKDHYYKYYSRQVGGFGVFQGATSQRGSGSIGSLPRGLAKSTLPLLKEGGKILGKQLLSTGLGIAEDVTRGKNFRDAARDNFKETGHGLIKEISSRVYAQPKKRRAAPPKRGKMTKKRRRTQPKVSLLRNVKLSA